MRRTLIWPAAAGVLTAVACLAAGTPPERPPVPVLRETLDRILASGYQLTEPPEVRLRELIARILRWLRDLFGDVSEIAPLGGLPQWLQSVIAGVLVIVLLLIVAHIVVSFRRLLAERRSRADEPEREVVRRDPDAVLRSAEAALARGEHHLALRLLYLAVLLRLDRLGLLPHDPARTNWENARALHAEGAVDSAMARLAGEVDACLYGGQDVTRQTWERARGWAETLWRAEDAS